MFANSRPSASNFKSFARSLEQFSLTVGQNNFSNKYHFFKTASSVCQSLRVKLQYNALEANSNMEGTYSLTSLVNGQPSWISESCGCGIWFNKGDFQLDFLSISGVINHMTCYKLSALIG